MPLNDAHLLDADVGYVLAACRGLVSDELYQGHFTRLTSQNQAPTQVLKSFFENLAELDSEHQDGCFEAIVRLHKEMNEEGSVYVVKRLLEGIVARQKLYAQVKGTLPKGGTGIDDKKGEHEKWDLTIGLKTSGLSKIVEPA